MKLSVCSTRLTSLLVYAEASILGPHIITCCYQQQLVKLTNCSQVLSCKYSPRCHLALRTGAARQSPDAIWSSVAVELTSTATGDISLSPHVSRLSVSIHLRFLGASNCGNCLDDLTPSVIFSTRLSHLIKHANFTWNVHIFYMKLMLIAFTFWISHDKIYKILQSNLELGVIPWPKLLLQMNGT